jgi:serine protease Do
MKKYILIAFVSAIVGGLIVALTVSEMGIRQVATADAVTTQARFTNYDPVSNGRTEFQDFQYAASKVLPSVVHISSTVRARGNELSTPFNFPDLPYQFRQFFDQPNRDSQRLPGPPQGFRQGSGSGVIISKDGYIVTNNHVVENADKLEVDLFDKRSFKAKVIGTDPSTDLALLKIDAEDLPAITIANSDDVAVGEWVLAIGNPFNLEGTVTAGIVSAKGRNINILEGKAPIESFIQTDAAINPGNSGGALVNPNGQLVGINSAIASPTGAYAGYGFAIPSRLVDKVVSDLREYGTVQRAYLGAVIRQIDGHFAEENNLSVNEYVWIDSLMTGGAAEKAGLKKGDIIQEIDGVPTRTSSELLEIIGRHRPGDKLTLTVLRKSKELNIPVSLKNRLGNSDVVKKESSSALLESLGADFKTLDKETADRLHLDGGVQVENLRAGRLRMETDMRNGFIITSVNNQAVKTVDQLIKAMNDAKGGGVMLQGVYEGVPGAYYYAFGLGA